MSVKEASIGHAQGRVGLRRKLTGPPRLLLGKSKTSSDMERKGKTWAWGQKRLGDGNGTKEDSMPGCQDTIIEEVPLESTTESPRKPPDSKEEEVTLENTMGTTKSPSTEQSDVKADHSNQTLKREKQGIRKHWKRCFSPSLICIGRWRKRAGKKEDKEEGHDITFFNKQTRDFAVQPTAVYGVTTSVKQVNNCSSLDTTAMKGKEEKLKVKTWRIFKRLMMAPSDQSKKKQEQLGPEISLQDHSSCVISFKKKTVNLWRHRTKKPSPFFQERIGGTQEYIEEETIVLANRHADDITELMNPNPHPLDVVREAKAHCSETLTVSVDVSVMKSEDSEVRDTIETSTETKAYENPAPTTDKMETKKYPEHRLKQVDEMLVTPYPIETYSCPGNDGVNLVVEVEEVQRHSGFSESVTSSTVAPDYLLLGEDFTSNAINKHIDLNAICEDAFVHNRIKAMEENTPTSIMANESVKEDSHLESDMSDDVHLYPIELNNSLKTGCDTFHGILNAENNGDSKQNCDVQQKEVHLLETACSVVQVVITAAMDQLREELVNSVTTLTQEEREC
ncbi:uncharacterized protein LOC121544382 [Coregonus clupeaformis]|uniref:uncharacterized protein LOC121544382 n=1 Tax=Coregonus clupeaformis TaxID=59861 RepID=UPI001BDFA672|nr:uncharacterized protein LOC121544382 [Coregonus clupeaformis]